MFVDTTRRQVLICVDGVPLILQDFHRKLEIEKLERRNSDSKALQLLEEVREQGRIAHELRENEAK